MADTKGANISKMMLKQAGRAKEKILQNLGKSDKTTDEIFEEHQNNFNAQQVNATRLHKDINNYLRCIRAMQTASKNLMETLHDIYEKEWVGQDQLYMQAQNTEMLWADLAHKLSDQVVIPLNTYQGQLPEMRKKIDKRGRKLIDYDAERHSVQTMQNNANRNEGKFVRAKESMENAKRTYELLNSELHDELPALYDSRILFLVTNMQTLFSAEEVFHSEMSKVYNDLESTVDKLAKEVQKGTLPRRILPKPQPLGSINSAPVINNSSQLSTSLSSPPKGASTENLPPGVLYKVKASYKYQAEDADELQFEVGEVIHVVEYDDPEEQEEGWLMGVKESSGQKGMFPANFTRPI
jgi:amphiphysin